MTVFASHAHRGASGCLSVFGINTTAGVENARPILLMCRNYCQLLEGSSMLDPYDEHHPETGYAPGASRIIALARSKGDLPQVFMRSASRADVRYRPAHRSQQP